MNVEPFAALQNDPLHRASCKMFPKVFKLSLIGEVSADHICEKKWSIESIHLNEVDIR